MLSVRIQTQPELKPRVLWALESLLAPAGEPITHVTDLRQPVDIAIGTTVEGDRCVLDHDESAWSDTARTCPKTSDILAQAFWWLARIEERSAHKAGEASAFDEHDRFRYEASALADSPHLAPVDMLALSLMERLKLEPQDWGDGAPYALALSHDIDEPVKLTRQGFKRLLRQGRDAFRSRDADTVYDTLGAVMAAPFQKMFGRDPHMNMPHICALEKRYGASSTFFLINGHSHPIDGNKDAYDSVREKLIKQITEGGGEVGLHGSYHAANTPGKLAEELEALSAEVGASITSHRFHYLHHQAPRHWKVMAEAGIRVDGSLGYAEMPGFRSGFSWPYYAFDLANNEPLDLLLIPLALMDATLDRDDYLGVSADRAKEHVDLLLDHARKHKSGFSILWHNDRYYSRLAGGMDEVYEYLISNAKLDGAEMSTCGAVARAWCAGA